LEKEKFEKEMNAATTKCKKNGKGTKVTI